MNEHIQLGVIYDGVGQIVPAVQPVCPSPWQESTHDLFYEVLARLLTPTGHLLTPAEFFGNALDIPEVDRAILELVPRLQAYWPTETFSINLSPISLCDLDYLDRLKSLIRHREISTNRLILEITEDQLHDPLTDLEVQACLDHLREHGVRIALDDFGNGGNGIGRLMYGHYDMIKMAPSLDITHPRGAIIIEHLLKMVDTLQRAHQGEIAIVVEGIERLDQFKRAAYFDVHYLQGYLLAPPAPLPPPPYAISERGRWLVAETLRLDAERPCYRQCQVPGAEPCLRVCCDSPHDGHRPIATAWGQGLEG